MGRTVHIVGVGMTGFTRPGRRARQVEGVRAGLHHPRGRAGAGVATVCRRMAVS